MALIICSECGKEFSDKAPSCPNCGCPTIESLTPPDLADKVESKVEKPIFDVLYETYPDDREAAAKEFSRIKGCTMKQARNGVNNFYDAKIGKKKKSFLDSFAGTPQKSNTQRKPSNSLECPHCGSHNIDLLSDSVNMKEFSRTGMNLNPLHPLTFFKTKTVKKEKNSAAKIGLGIITGGTSLLVTGTKNKKHNEYYCRNCGNRWVAK